MGSGATPEIPQDEPILSSPRSRFRAAMMLAIVADVAQIVLFPLFGEGAISPFDDVLDVAVAFSLVRLVGWHWEFLPSFFAELGRGPTWFPSGPCRWPVSTASGSRRPSPSRSRRTSSAPRFPKRKSSFRSQRNSKTHICQSADVGHPGSAAKRCYNGGPITRIAEKKSICQSRRRELQFARCECGFSAARSRRW